MLFSLFSLAFVAPLCLGDHLTETYPFTKTLSEGYYYLFWNFSSIDETIQFAVRVKTTGWVGFGISPNGQMPGSDVVIGWIDRQKSYFHDRYARGRYEPLIDNMQDWFLISARQDDGYTELEFSRNFTTCDNESQDIDIMAHTSRIVYSWNDELPITTQISDELEIYSIKQHQNQGSASINLLGGLHNPPQIPSDLKSFNVEVKNVAVPDKATTYWCKGVRISEIIDSYDEEKYIVKFSPKITTGLPHHMLIFLCNAYGLEESDVGPGGECDDQSDAVRNCLGGLLIGGWAVGGSDFIYPHNAAYPIGGPDSRHYAVINIHYSNPQKRAGIVDSSGMTFTYLETPREYDAGILFMGHVFNTLLDIPPNAANYSVAAFCPVKCTEKFFPPDGIKIFASMLHTHVKGIGVTLSVIRENDNGEYHEVRPVEKNLNYDFNFQQINYLTEEITVLPGDILLLHCYYNTTGINGTIVGGEGTQDEMCNTFPLYYPKVEMNVCMSRPLFFDQLPYFIEEAVPAEDQLSFAVLLDDTSRPTIQATLDQLEWNEQQINSFENKMYQSGQQLAYCHSDTEFSAAVEQVPDVCCYYDQPKPVRNCAVIETEDGASITHWTRVDY